MPITAVCPKCRGRFQAGDDAAGKAVACPRCQARVTIPAGGGTPAEPEPWFIAFAAGLAYVWLVVGFLAAMLNLVAVSAAAREAGKLSGEGSGGGAMWGALGSFAAHVLVVLTSS